MRRWNGWGDTGIHPKLPASALDFLRSRAGDGRSQPDASFDALVTAVAPSRLPSHESIDTSPATRLLHARGQSLPDWLALRFGRIERVPDGVAFPQTAQEVRTLLGLARQIGARVIPYGGGTSVVGHLTAPEGAQAVLTISLARMRRLRHLDTASRLATFDAGVTGPDLEAQLQTQGYTLGHFPQSFEYSTLGGWIATRSSGQESLGYGRIEDMLAGASIETPVGTLRVPTAPASAAGIDMRGLILGSEGRLGIVTEATVRIRPLPEDELVVGYFFPTWERAENAVHALVHARLSLSMLRLANATETLATLRLGSSTPTLAVLEQYLALRGCRQDKCLLLIGVTGDRAVSRATIRAARSIASNFEGRYFGRRIGDRWKRNRFRSVYLRNTLWEAGYAVDTIETAVDWPRVRGMMRAIEDAGRSALDGGGVLAYSHLSHVYAQGSSVYSTFIFPLAREYETNMERWRRLKVAASEAIVAHGGTISHQHGVGIDHKPYLVAEKGPLGLAAMQSIFHSFDPDGIMNAGKLC